MGSTRECQCLVELFRPRPWWWPVPLLSIELRSNFYRDEDDTTLGRGRCPRIRMQRNQRTLAPSPLATRAGCRPWGPFGCGCASPWLAPSSNRWLAATRLATNGRPPHGDAQGTVKCVSTRRRQRLLLLTVEPPRYGLCAAAARDRRRGHVRAASSQDATVSLMPWSSPRLARVPLPCGSQAAVKPPMAPPPR